MTWLLLATWGGLTACQGDPAVNPVDAALAPWPREIDALLERIEEGRSPADDLLDAWTKDPSPEAVIAAVTY